MSSKDGKMAEIRGGSEDSSLVTDGGRSMPRGVAGGEKLTEKWCPGSKKMREKWVWPCRCGNLASIEPFFS